MPRKAIPGFEELSVPLNPNDPKYYYYGLVSLLLKTLGGASEGLRLGFEYGFDSGIIMNYIYENKPHGTGFIGKKIDASFLEQVTCKAFRSIRGMQADAIRSYLSEREGQDTFIVDLASGKADYIYDALLDNQSNVTVLLRDISQNTIDESRRTAERLGLSDHVSFELGNALDAHSLSSIKPSPDLVVEVGLYGIIHDDELIKKHFHDLMNILKPKALLFNVQTYNEQIELIARSLVNQDGGPCVWHLRPVEQVIAWAQEAGFSEPGITMDPYGIYAVVTMRGK